MKRNPHANDVHPPGENAMDMPLHHRRRRQHRHAQYLGSHPSL